jgi:hypothetical protein
MPRTTSTEDFRRHRHPPERSGPAEDGEQRLFTLGDLDQHFMNTLMAGIINPAPRQDDDAKAAAKPEKSAA